MSPMKCRMNFRASLRVRKGLVVLRRREVCGGVTLCLCLSFALCFVDGIVCGGEERFGVSG